MAAGLVEVNKNTATLFYHKLRETITERIAGVSPFGGEIDDESCFGGHRKGKRGRGAAGKVVVFGILKRGGRGYTAVPADLSVVITYGLNVYDTLDAEGFEHARCSHDDGYVQYEPNGTALHINGIENFWS